jgi:hypothetical protein
MLGFAAGCTPHVVLRVADSQGVLGPLQRCPEGSGPCADDPTYDGSQNNLSNTRFFRLPACANGIDSIRVEAGEAIVQCAAPAQNSLGTTSSTSNP